jgi:uncharacterized protein YndB with AHSA1/START domain
MRSTRVTRHLDASPAEVYRVLLDADSVPRWKVPASMTCMVHEFEGREGGRQRVSLTYDEPDRAGKTTAHTDTYTGRFTRLVPDRLVVEEDEFETDDPSMSGVMTITITLEEAGGGTDLTAVHDGLPSGVTLEDNVTGWNESLDRLASLLSGAR